MRAFILELPEAAASPLTEACLRGLPPVRDIRVLRPPFGLHMNEQLAGCAEPFVLTLRAGTVASSRLGQKLLDWTSEWEPGCAGLVPASSDCPGAAGGEPFLWRTDAVRGAFPDYDWQPFDELAAADAMERLRSRGWMFKSVDPHGAIAFEGALGRERCEAASRSRLADCRPVSFQRLGSSRRLDPLCRLNSLRRLLRASAEAGGGGGTPAISVVLCVYNDAHYLPWAIRSVLGQTLREWELLVVDDGSTDAPENVLDRIGPDGRIVYVRLDPNRGKAAALNAALDRARGRWLLELDADDWLAPDTLETMLASADRAEAGTVMAYGDYAEWVESRSRRLQYSGIRRFAGARGKARILADGVPLAPRLYRTGLVKRAGGWSTSSLYGGRLYEDMEMIGKLAEAGPLLHIPKVLYHRRLRATSVTHRSGADYAKWLRWAGRQEDLSR